MEELKPTEIKKAVTEDNKKEKINVKYLRDKYRKKVKGKFIFHECPGGFMKFSFREFKGDPIATYEFTDGEIYEIPLGVAIHLNKHCFYPAYEYIREEGMQNVVKATRKVRRVSFQSLEFVDLDELSQQNLYTVEYASGM